METNNLNEEDEDVVIQVRVISFIKNFIVSEGEPRCIIT